MLTRDMDLVRLILLEVEQTRELASEQIDGIGLGGYTEDQIVYHVELMAEAGLINANVQHYLGGETPTYLISRLTWKGHEFLDTVRDPAIWRNTKAGAAKVGGWTFDVLKDLGTGFIKLKAQELGLPL